MIVGKLLEGQGGNYGYNAATNEYGDLVKQGIIDPLKVIAWSQIWPFGMAGTPEGILETSVGSGEERVTGSVNRTDWSTVIQIKVEKIARYCCQTKTASDLRV